MAKKQKETEVNSSDEAFEIIELASNDLESLAKAFNMMAELCREMSTERVETEPSEMQKEILVH